MGGTAMSMIKPQVSQTIVASSVFLDLVGFSKLSTSAQVQAKDRFNTTLRASLDELGPDHYWVRDLGDGALIICPHSPEHALFLALRVHKEFLAFLLVPGQPVLALRIGLNLGVLKTSPDLEGRPNYLGDGINATQRVMDFAQPGQILASRSFVDAIAFLHGDYTTMFDAPQQRADKHGRVHEVHAVEPSAAALERLQGEFNAKPDVANVQVSQSVTLVRDVPESMMTAGSRPLKSRGRILGVWIALALTFLLVAGYGVWLATARVEKAPVTGAVAQPKLTGFKATDAPPVPQVTPAQMPSADAPIQTEAPAPAATKVGKKSAPLASRDTTKSAKSVKPVAENPMTEEVRARCIVLLNKSALGSVVSPAEKRELMQSCH